MKVLNLNLNGQTYLSGEIKSFLSRKALEIQKETLAIAQKGKKFASEAKEEDMDSILDMLTTLSDLRDKKTWLICEVYHNQFTADELEKELTDEEIDQEVNKIVFGISGVITKN